MRNTNIFDLIHKVVLVILLMGTLPLALPAAENLIYNLKFKQLSAPYALPTNEVQKVYQDKDGEYHLLEVKDTQYKGLGPHLLDQLHQREEFFGENTDVLFSISGGKLTFGEAEALQRYAEKNGINIEFMLK